MLLEQTNVTMGVEFMGHVPLVFGVDGTPCLPPRQGRHF